MRQYLLIFTVFLCYTLQGQFVYTPDPVDVNARPNSTDIVADIEVTNMFDTDVSFLWSIERDAAPMEWEFQLCDQNLCYNWGVEDCPTSKPNLLVPGEDMLFMIHLNPHEIESQSQVNLRVYLESNTDSTIVNIPINYSIMTTSSSDDVSDPDNLVIYPNPTEDFFQIKSDDNVSEVLIFNIVGKRLATFNHTPGKNYDISELEKGLYLVRLLDKSNNIIKVLRLTKK